MSFLSYAQNAEDVLLARVLEGTGAGFYIDVGANDPVRDSVTKHFYDRGWRGINIEPGPEMFARLARERPRDINLNVGLSDREGTLAFFESLTDRGWSTFSADQARSLHERGFELVERCVAVTTLARVCREHATATIDFLKIDAESHEREVIQGADWGAFRPRVVLVENNGREIWEPLILAADYLTAAFDGINRYYVRSEDRGLLPRFEAPVSVADDYIPYKYQSVIADLQARLDLYGRLSPAALAVAIRMQQVLDRRHRLVAAACRLLRRAG